MSTVGCTAQYTTIAVSSQPDVNYVAFEFGSDLTVDSSSQKSNNDSVSQVGITLLSTSLSPCSLFVIIANLRFPLHCIEMAVNPLNGGPGPRPDILISNHTEGTSSDAKCVDSQIFEHGTGIDGMGGGGGRSEIKMSPPNGSGGMNGNGIGKSVNRTRTVNLTKAKHRSEYAYRRNAYRTQSEDLADQVPRFGFGSGHSMRGERLGFGRAWPTRCRAGGAGAPVSVSICTGHDHIRVMRPSGYKMSYPQIVITATQCRGSPSGREGTARRLSLRLGGAARWRRR